MSECYYTVSDCTSNNSSLETQTWCIETVQLCVSSWQWMIFSPFLFLAIYTWVRVRELQPSSISPFSTTWKWWRRKGAPRRQRTEEGNICYVTWSGGAASYLLSLYNATTASKKTSFSSVGARANANLLSQRSTHSDFLPNNSKICRTKNLNVAAYSFQPSEPILQMMLMDNFPFAILCTC